MLDAVTTVLLRAVSDELCDNPSRNDTGIRTHVAAKIVEVANRGERTREAVRQIGFEALRQAPTMWR